MEGKREALASGYRVASDRATRVSNLLTAWLQCFWHKHREKQHRDGAVRIPSLQVCGVDKYRCTLHIRRCRARNN